MRPSVILATFGGIFALCRPIADTDASPESVSTPPLAVVERGEEAELHHERHKWIGE